MLKCVLGRLSAIVAPLKILFSVIKQNLRCVRWLEILLGFPKVGRWESTIQTSDYPGCSVPPPDLWPPQQSSVMCYDKKLIFPFNVCWSQPPSSFHACLLSPSWRWTTVVDVVASRHRPTVKPSGFPLHFLSFPHLSVSDSSVIREENTLVHISRRRHSRLARRLLSHPRPITQPHTHKHMDTPM